MNLLIIGIQGSGKGTQSKLVAEKYGLVHISTGDLIRKEIAEQTELGKQVEGILAQGKFFSDEQGLQLLEKNLPENDFILDGYPRNLNQARDLDGIRNIDNVLYLDLPESEVIHRLSNRRHCSCGEHYGLNRMPEQEGLCDKCGKALLQRDDDTPNAIKKRIELFYELTQPLLDHYKNRLIKINGNQSVDDVFSEIERKLR